MVRLFHKLIIFSVYIGYIYGDEINWLDLKSDYMNFDDNDSLSISLSEDLTPLQRKVLEKFWDEDS